MPKKRRVFSAQFKSDLVIELLKGEKELNVIATENNIQPNLLRRWKEEFLQNASMIFDDHRESNLKKKLEAERKENAAYAKKVGQLTMEVDWLKKICRVPWTRLREQIYSKAFQRLKNYLLVLRRRY